MNCAAMMLAVIIGVGLPFPLAAMPPLEFTDPALQQRYQSLLAELRCLVCQNQSLLDSNADLADDLRIEVHRLLHQGESDDAILEFMTTRYGDFVLYRPPLGANTWLLWATPFLMLAVALGVLWYIVQRHRRRPLDDGGSVSG